MLPGILHEKPKNDLFLRLSRLGFISDSIVQPLLLINIALCIFLTAELKQASMAAAGAELSEHLVEVVFTLFDEDSKLCFSAHSAHYCTIKLIEIV